MVSQKLNYGLFLIMVGYPAADLERFFTIGTALILRGFVADIMGYGGGLKATTPAMH